MTKTKGVISIEKIENKIYIIRGYKVMIDSDLAVIYGVETRVLNQAVKRNVNRFPSDFMFLLTNKEVECLMSQSVISKSTDKKESRGGRRKLPYVFTEHGAVMLASVLNSEVAVKASIQVVRAFVKLREVFAAHKELAAKIEKLERKHGSKLNKHDKELKILFEAIRQLMEPPSPPRKKIGYKRYDENE